MIQFYADDKEHPAAAFLMHALYFILACLAIYGVWKLTMYYKDDGGEVILNYYEGVRNSPFLFLWVLLGFAISAVLFVPITLMILIAITLFSPLPALLAALTGAAVNASLDRKSVV